MYVYIHIYLYVCIYIYICVVLVFVFMLVLFHCLFITYLSCLLVIRFVSCVSSFVGGLVLFCLLLFFDAVLMLFCLLFIVISLVWFVSFLDCFV